MASTETFLYHLLALVIVTVFAFVGSLILYKVTDMLIPLRVTGGSGARGAGPEPAWRNGAGRAIAQWRWQWPQERH